MRKIKNIRPIVIFILMCIFLFCGYLFINYSHNIDQQLDVKFEEKSDIDYKVYLKKNSFFETPYLEKNKTYIASLIDYVLINYKYSFNVSDSINGTYTYYIKGTLSANKNNSNDSYWSKDYILSEKNIKEYNDTKKIDIESEIKIDYQLYNNLLNDFKSQYGVSMDGMLEVSLVIENMIENNLVDRKISKNSNISLNIPLTSLTIEVPIESSDLNNNGTLISETVQQNVLYYTIFKYAGYVCISIAILLLALIMAIIVLKNKYDNKYYKILKKIFKTYDNIIVNSSDLPNLDDLNVVSVTSFDELIDAHGEVRKPINCVSYEDKTIFILINEGMAWRYDLINEYPRKKRGRK